MGSFLRGTNYPLDFQRHGHMFHGVAMVRVLRQTAFGVLFCLSHQCALCLFGMKLTFREPGRKLVCENYGYKCHQHHEAIQPPEHGVFGGHFVRLNWGCPLLVSVACHVPGQHSSTAVYTLLPLGERGRSSAWPSVFALPREEHEIWMNEDSAQGDWAGRPARGRGARGLFPLPWQLAYEVV